MSPKHDGTEFICQASSWPDLDMVCARSIDKTSCFCGMSCPLPGAAPVGGDRGRFVAAMGVLILVYRGPRRIILYNQNYDTSIAVRKIVHQSGLHLLVVGEYTLNCTLVRQTKVRELNRLCPTKEDLSCRQGVWRTSG
jgi:hypothetical protein